MMDFSKKDVGYFLGVAGLIPFAAGAYFSFQWGENRALAVDGLLAYAALIITFIGALHWGRNLHHASGKSGKTFWMVWSIIPCMLAWPLLFLAHEIALFAAIGVLFICLAFDIVAYRLGHFPDWMMRLRYLLTSGASACLLAAWISGLEELPEYLQFISVGF